MTSRPAAVLLPIFLALWCAATPADAAGPPLPPARPAEPPSPSAVAVNPDPPPPEGDVEQCLTRLVTLQVSAEPQPSITEGACGAADPLTVSALSDTVRLSGGVETVCPMAEAAARWAADVVVPAARQHLGRTLAAIAVGTSYACRGQNRVVGAKLSEHAYANALDIAGFTFTDGAPVSVKASDPATPEGRFTAAVRQGACSIFTTVLGPGSDSYHADHLHLDLRARRAGHGICE